MKSVLAKIFSGECDDEVHIEFIKFGKGIYENRYLIDVKKQKKAWSVKTSAEFANFLVRACLEETEQEVAVKGVIISTFDIASKAGFQIAGVKKYLGITQAVIDTTVAPQKILALMNAYPRAFYALSFSTPASALKVKPKAPKSGKPAANGEKEVAANFCSLRTTNAELVKELLFDVPDASEVKIRHTLAINEIVLPQNVSDTVQLREQAKRKGTITRFVRADGAESKGEVEFEA